MKSHSLLGQLLLVLTLIKIATLDGLGQTQQAFINLQTNRNQTHPAPVQRPDWAPEKKTVPAPALPPDWLRETPGTSPGGGFKLNLQGRLRHSIAAQIPAAGPAQVRCQPDLRSATNQAPTVPGTEPKKGKHELECLP